MRRRHNGMTLIEIVASMVLLVIVIAAASRLMMSNIQALHKTNETIGQAVDLDLMLGRMKRDVWSASEVSVDGKSITLRSPDRSITWRVLEEGGAERRVDNDREQVWPAPEGLSFDAASEGVSVNLGEGPAMLMVSQVLRGGAS